MYYRVIIRFVYNLVTPKKELRNEFYVEDNVMSMLQISPLCVQDKWELPHLMFVNNMSTIAVIFSITYRAKRMGLVQMGIWVFCCYLLSQCRVSPDWG